MRPDAIAVVGMACRLPQSPDPEAFWQLLRSGRDAITEPPEDRRHAGARPGGFLDRVDQFDAGFFNISPREAAAMDPRQRLTLELSWEALEDAAIDPARLSGSRTAVVVGAIGDDYATVAHGQGRAIDSHTLTGLHRSLIANRTSYALGLRGPSLTVDTGQSSSLVAVHLACESLRTGESTLAIAGGVSLNLAPESTLSAERFGALSADHRCHTFDARANGYVRGEGGGLVVLKPLDRAIADADPVYCVIRGSAVNNDGHSGGLTVPSADAQREVIRLACERAGVDPAEVQHVELHGTGTKVGDPVEAAALGAVYGADRRDGAPLRVGSVKTNIGHLEAAAGIAGLLKAALSISHREIPPSLNFAVPHPRIPLDALRLRVQTTLGPWPRPDEPLLSGVSSFGMGGTNCHVLLSDGPLPPRDPVTAVFAGTGHSPGGDPPPVPWVVSAKTVSALRAQAARLHTHLSDRTDLDIVDIGHTLATGRAAFPHRAVVLASTRHDLLAGLAAVAREEPAEHVFRGTVEDPGGIVFAFPADAPLHPDAVLRLGRALAEAYVSGAPVRWDHAFAGRRAHLPTYPFERRRHWLEPDPAAAAVPAATPATPAPPAATRPETLLDLVRAETAAVLGHSSPDDVAADRPFHDAGLDSMDAVELGNRVSAATGVDVPDTLLFDHPTPAALARYLHDRIVAGPPAPEIRPESDLDRIAAELLAAGDPDRRAAVAAKLRDLASQLDAPQYARLWGHDFTTATDEQLFAALDHVPSTRGVDDGR